MHWSDVMAKRLGQRGDKHIVATGITPSGEFHIGHLREILTGDMIARAARRAGMDAELVFVVVANWVRNPISGGVFLAVAHYRHAARLEP